MIFYVLPFTFYFFRKLIIRRKKMGEKDNFDNETQVIKDKIDIVDLFNTNELTATTNGYKMTCPDCGLQGGRTSGFILFPDSNTAYCHSSGKWFTLLETYALKNKIIRCLDGRDKGDTKAKVLGGELFTLALEEFNNEFGTAKFDTLINQLNIKKEIELPGNNRLISRFCDELADIYKSRNILFYRGDAMNIVEIGRYKKIDKDGEFFVENGFVEIDSLRFITFAEMLINPYSEKTDKLTLVTTRTYKSMMKSIADIVLKSPNFQNKLPPISRIFDIQMPIMYNNRLTFPKKGYDRRFGSWLPYNSPEIDIDRFNLHEAKQIIDKMFEEFCFRNEKDRTHAIAGFITPFLRGILPTFSTRTPIYIYMANRERAGKDYCAGCSGIVYEGINIEEPPISNDGVNGNNNEEIRKKLMGCMLQGKKRFHSAFEYSEESVGHPKLIKAIVSKDGVKKI